MMTLQEQQMLDCSAFPKLCRTLLHYLQGRPLLNDEAKSSLLEIRTEIDLTLCANGGGGGVSSHPLLSPLSLASLTSASLLSPASSPSSIILKQLNAAGEEEERKFWSSSSTLIKQNKKKKVASIESKSPFFSSPSSSSPASNAEQEEEDDKRKKIIGSAAPTRGGGGKPAAASSRIIPSPAPSSLLSPPLSSSSISSSPLSALKSKREEGESEKKKKSPKKKRKDEEERRGKTMKKRVMVAVEPYRELGDIESNLTVMEWLAGRTAYDRWWRWKRVLRPVFWLTMSSMAGSLTGAMVLGGWTAYLVSLVVWMAGILLGLLQSIALSNVRVLEKSLQTFESLIFIGETLFFTLSFAGVFCFTWVGGLLALTTFFGTVTSFVFYDSYPASVRSTGSRQFFVMFSIWIFSLLLLLYFRVPRDMCSYRLDLRNGLLNEEVPEERQRITQWSMSVTEFCLNRAVNILMLTLRVVYLAFRHPNDCVFVRSRVRVVELPLLSSSSAALASSSSPSSLPGPALLPPNPSSLFSKRDEDGEALSN